MKKSIILAAAFLSLVACQKTQQTEATAEEAVIETPDDTVMAGSDTIAVAETEQKADAVANEDKDIKVVAAKEVKVDYASFGDKIAADKAITKEEMLRKYKSLKPGDTVTVKFKSKINEVCQKKGCWMSLELPSGESSFVKFKDYAFFVPLNAAGQEAIVNGKAFISETSVAQRKHYAKDGGASDEEIAKITQPEVEYKFMANGVLISH